MGDESSSPEMTRRSSLKSSLFDRTDKKSPRGEIVGGE